MSLVAGGRMVFESPNPRSTARDKGGRKLFFCAVDEELDIAFNSCGKETVGANAGVVFFKMKNQPPASTITTINIPAYILFI